MWKWGMHGELRFSGFLWQMLHLLGAAVVGWLSAGKWLCNVKESMGGWWRMMVGGDGEVGGASSGSSSIGETRIALADMSLADSWGLGSKFARPVFTQYVEKESREYDFKVDDGYT